MAPFCLGLGHACRAASQHGGAPSRTPAQCHKLLMRATTAAATAAAPAAASQLRRRPRAFAAAAASNSREPAAADDAAASAAAASNSSEPAAAGDAAASAAEQAEGEEDLTLLAWVAAELEEHGDADPASPEFAATVRRLAGLATLLHARAGVAGGLATALVLQHSAALLAGEPADDAGTRQLLLAKFALFRRLCSAEPGCADALARAFTEGGDGDSTALLLPLADTEAALAFAAAQLPRLDRRRFEALHGPHSLARFAALHPEAAGALLRQHPAPFAAHAAPWLRSELGWDDAALAAAALSPSLPQYCTLDPAAASAWLDWLLGLGLTRGQAGRLLAAAPQLLVGPPRELASKRQRAEEAAAAWGVGGALAAALLLAQPYLSATGAERTGRVVSLLRDTAGMGEGQVLEAVLGGALDGGATASERAFEAATERLKGLLLVFGSWPAVGAALLEHPEILHISWSGVEALLPGEAQRRAWRAAAGRQQQQRGGGAWG